jgi:hypothetical protein
MLKIEAEGSRMPFNDSNKAKKKTDSQRKRSGDCVAFVHLSTQGFTPVYDEIPRIHAISTSSAGQVEGLKTPQLGTTQ